MKPRIEEIVGSIPENSENEALNSIQSIMQNPHGRCARLNCHLSSKFSVYVQITGEAIAIEAPGLTPVTTDAAGFLSALKRVIYATDEAIAAGQYTPPAPRANIILNPPPPPANMDLPTLDADKGIWYDAEY